MDFDPAIPRKKNFPKKVSGVSGALFYWTFGIGRSIGSLFYVSGLTLYVSGILSILGQIA